MNEQPASPTPTWQPNLFGNGARSLAEQQTFFECARKARDLAPAQQLYRDDQQFLPMMKGKEK